MLNKPIDGVIITGANIWYYKDYYKGQDYVSNYLKKCKAGQEALSYNAADVNRDGSINASDVVAIYNTIIAGESK